VARPDVEVQETLGGPIDFEAGEGF
jgi:hypothetical protein